MSGLDSAAIQQTPMWNHMVKVLSHVVSERPADPLAALTTTSSYILTGSAVPPKAAATLMAENRVAAAPDVPADALVNTRWAANMTRSLAPMRAPRRPRAADGFEDEDDYGADGEGAEEHPGAAPSIVQQQLAQAEADAIQGTIEDTVAEQASFNAAGVGLPREEAFRVVVGLKQLMKAEPLASVRFWGKITGSASDYYVAETKIDPSRLPEEEEDMGDDMDGDDEDGLPLTRVAAVLGANVAKRHRSTPPEEAGTGLNEFVYFAASAADPTVWSRLPDVLPQYIVVARKIRNGFTGDLEADVHSHPRFPWKEKAYLRAQIARISCACRIAPRDAFVTEGAVPEEEDDDGNPLPPPAMVPAYAAVPPLLPQEAPDEEDAEAVQAVQAWLGGYAHEELLQARNWSHIAPTLLAAGRVTVAPPAEPEEDAGDDVAPEEPDEDGAVERPELISPFLSDLATDATLAFPGHSRRNLPAWSFRQAFHNEGSGTSIYLARSTLWPGAFTYAVTTRGTPGADHQMVYVGNGLKNLLGVIYAPELPPVRMCEFPEDALVLQRDCTVDEELAYAPAPAVDGDEEDEEGDEDGDDEY